MTRRHIFNLMGLVIACGTASIAMAAPISINTNLFTYAQNFDTLRSASGSGAWANSSTLAGWSAFNALPGGTAVAGDRDTPSGSGYNAVTSITSNIGGSGAAAFYSFGSNASAERAMGAFGSSATGDFFFGVEFTNDTGSTIDSITVGYRGEQWRGVTATTNSIYFDYSATSSSFWDNASFTNSPALTFTNPQTPAMGTRAYDGNAAGDFTVLGPVTISSLGLAPGATLRLRWYTDSANVDALAVDDFAFTATAVPEPAALGLIALAAVGLRRRAK